MAAESIVRIQTEIQGLGQNLVWANKSADSETPTDAAGPVYVVLGTAPQQLDLISIGAQELRGVSIAAKSGSVYVGPVSSANITAACFISEGNALHLMYQPGVTAVPWVQGDSSSAACEYIVWGVST